ncbi:MAG TPA: phospholipid carrier-dependent glycosyltransferase [Chloroflexia bacterium]
MKTTIPKAEDPTLTGAQPDPDTTPEHPSSPQPPRRGISSHLFNALTGLLLFALYVTILARNDIDSLMGSGALPAIPGGWKSLAALQALALLATTTARVRKATQLSSIVPRATIWARSHKVALAVAGLTLGALALRLFGISDNLPYTSNPDEPAVADRALRILQTGDYNPHYFVYPNLYTYMQAAVYLPRFFLLVSSGALENLNQLVPTDFYLWGRMLTALLGTLTVPLVFLAGRRLYGTTAGLIAAAFMATNSVHMVYSQIITTDVPATFFSALSLLAIVRLLPPATTGQDTRTSPTLLPSRNVYIFAGIAMGLAVGTKYNSALVVLPFLLAHAYVVADHTHRFGARSRAFFGARLWLALISMVAAFLVTTPFALFDLPNFINDIASVLAHYRFGHLGFEGDDNWRFYFGTFLQSDLLPTLLTLVGVVIALARRSRADLLLLSFPLVFYLSMSSYRVNFTRNMLPIIPFTSILAAISLALAWKALLTYLSARQDTASRPVARLAPWLLGLVVALGVLPQTAGAIQRGYRQTQPDTRLRAAQWLDANTRPGTKLWMEFDTPKLTQGRYLLGTGQHVTEHPMEWYVANRYEYLVLSAGAYKPVVYDRPESNPPLRDAYLRFFNENKANLVASFETNKVDHPGPTIQIYRTGYTPPQSPADVRAQQPVNAQYHELDPNGGTITLIGADYPDQIEAGSTLPLTLYWTADRALNTNYTVFVHLIDASGNKLAQIDVGPRSGTYPTSLWPPGEVIVDEMTLTLPAELPPGEYNMRVGLYLQIDAGAHTAFTLTNAPPNSGGDYVLLGPVTAD